MPQRRRALLVAVLAAGLCGPARAGSLLPLRTEDAATLPAGRAELILGASYVEDPRFPPFTGKGALESQHVVTGPEIGFRIAAGDWAEIQAAFEMIFLREKTNVADSSGAANGETHEQFGAGDARLSAKVRVLKEKRYRPAVGARFTTKLPNANRDDRLGTDETDFGIEALASKDFGLLSAHANLGILLLGNPGPMLGAPGREGTGQDDLVSYSIGAASRPLLIDGERSLRLLAEVNGVDASHFDNERSALRLGAQARQGSWVLYAGASLGLITAGEDFGLGAGLLYDLDLERLFGGAE